MKRTNKKYAASEKWVVCLNCDHEYVIEMVVEEKGCPVCNSYAYEESSAETNNWEE